MFWDLLIVGVLVIFVGGMYVAIYHPDNPHTTRRRFMGKVSINIRTINAGKKCMAVAQVGGITLQGPLCSDPVEAVQSLLWQMGPNQPQLPQAAVGIALALEGTTIEGLAALDAAPEDKTTGNGA